MSDTSPAPLLALSMDDYESKLPLLDDMPLKKAKRYIEPLKYQALAGAVLGAFERYPAIQTISFEGDGTRDSNVSGYEILAQGPGTEDIPIQKQGDYSNMALPELDKLLWWFFDDEDFRADLSQSSFNRDDVVEQLKTMLDNEAKVWDVSWEEFVQRVYTHLGRPAALEEQAAEQAQVSKDPAVVELFRTLRLAYKPGFNETLDNAPAELYQARMKAVGLDGKKVDWSPLSRGLMFLFGHKDERANHDLWNTVTFTTHKEGPAAERFLKLAGPRDEPEAWAPPWADPLALMWIVTGRCSMAVNSHKRESWSEAMLAWAGSTGAQADYRTLDFCIRMAEEGWESPLFTSEAYLRCKRMVDKIWTVWIDGNSPVSDRPYLESFERMSTAILFYGKPSGHMAPWCADPHNLRSILGKGPGPVFSTTLSRLPPAIGLRLGLAILVKETEKENIAAAEACILGLLDGGATLKKDDPYLEKLLGGKGVTDALREKVRATLQ